VETRISGFKSNYCGFWVFSIFWGLKLIVTTWLSIIAILLLLGKLYWTHGGWVVAVARNNKTTIIADGGLVAGAKKRGTNQAIVYLR